MWAKSSTLLLVVVIYPPLAPPLLQGRGDTRFTSGGVGSGPIAVYEKACARCHGPNGSFYGPELGKGKTDAQLKRAVQGMADNQGQIELTPDEVEEQTAYHRAIIKNEPFIAITSQTKTELVGETMAKARITVTVAGKPMPVTRKGFAWQAKLEGEGPVLVRATLGKAETRLDPAKARHSHPAPRQ